MPKNREAGGMSVKNEAGHEEIKDFFGRHGQFLEKYAGDSSIRIEPSPKGLGTFAIDLENGRLFAEPSRFGDKGWGEDKILSSVLHEFEHFREFKELLDEKGGWEVYQRYKQKLAANRRFGILDNSFDDVKIDRRVGERAPILNGAIKRKYREDLFPVLDYTDQPKHLQFAYALKRRGKLPDEVIKLSPEVQAELDKLDVIASRGVKLLDYASRPDTPMSMRLDLQERFLEPAYERLFEQDVKEKEDQDKKDGGQGSGEGAEGDEGGEPGEEDGEPKGAKNKPKGKAKKSDKKPDGDKHAGPSGEDADEAGEPINPEDYFKDDYDKFDENNPQPVDYSSDEMKKKIEEYIEAQGKRDYDQEAREAYARAEGVSWQEVREYQ